MAADLTVNNLCDALKFFFRQIVDHPEQPVDREKGIQLFGTPGDDEMRALMEAFGGRITITVKEMPLAISQPFSAAVAEGQGGAIWEPSKDGSAGMTSYEQAEVG